MSTRRPGGLGRIVRRRQQEEFVGRQQELIGYRRNLALPFDDENLRFVYAISGQGGVGKTCLLRRFRKTAEERATVASWCDETQPDLPAVLGRLARPRLLGAAGQTVLRALP